MSVVPDEDLVREAVTETNPQYSARPVTRQVEGRDSYIRTAGGALQVTKPRIIRGISLGRTTVTGEELREINSLARIKQTARRGANLGATQSITGLDEDYFLSRLGHSWRSFSASEGLRNRSVELGQEQNPQGAILDFLIDPEVVALYNMTGAPEAGGSVRRNLVYSRNKQPVGEETTKKFVRHMAKFGKADPALSKYSKRKQVNFRDTPSRDVPARRGGPQMFMGAAAQGVGKRF